MLLVLEEAEWLVQLPERRSVYCRTMVTWMEKKLKKKKMEKKKHKP